MTLQRLADGRIAEQWAQYDLLGLLQQLGVLPAGEAAAAAPGPPARDAAAPGADVAALVRDLVAADNAGDLAAVGALLAEGYTDRTPTPGVPPTRDGYLAYLGALRAAFPDNATTLEDLVVDGGAAVARYTFRGTHRGALLGIPPTGRAVAIGGMALYHVARGQVHESWAVRDTLGLLQQLGVVPAG
jgi:steroid delta-isomerase-like uncharacterized protein